MAALHYEPSLACFAGCGIEENQLHFEEIRREKPVPVRRFSAFYGTKIIVAR
ncbi:hypothetical protein [Afipia carboxidovorans]|uniref:hypothetical protein n=1 Tax=Afipia carboxidovorans TaxID=40137 RepID=UPI001305444E|nr:hypothetical protein [Afipia carboxidovorans]